MISVLGSLLVMVCLCVVLFLASSGERDQVTDSKRETAQVKASPAETLLNKSPVSLATNTPRPTAITKPASSHTPISTAESITRVAPIPSLTPVPTLTPTSIRTPTPRATNAPTARPTPTSTPTPIPVVAYEGSYTNLPQEFLLGVGETLTAYINGIPVDTTLVSCEPAGDLAGMPYFEARFSFYNRGYTPVTISPTMIRAGDNSILNWEGNLDTRNPVNPISVEPNSRASMVLKWLFREGREIWIMVNTPVKNRHVTLAPGMKVFRVIPRATPTPTSLPKDSYEGNLKTIPSNFIMGVGDTLISVINGSTVDITLIGFEQTKLDRWGSGKKRYFKTRFLINNRTEAVIEFSLQDVFMGANDSGYRLSRGGEVSLITQDVIVIEGKSDTSVVLEWQTKAYNTIDGKTADQVVWITVNTPISEGLSVTLPPGSGVFRIYFPESDE